MTIKCEGPQHAPHPPKKMDEGSGGNILTCPTCETLITVSDRVLRQAAGVDE